MDIGDWLRSLDLGRYEQTFRDNEVDEQILSSLTAEDLKEIGVGPVGHRRKLLEAIAELSAGKPLPSLQQSAPVAPTDTHSSSGRRQLTVMFCDQIGSTALFAWLDWVPISKNDENKNQIEKTEVGASDDEIRLWRAKEAVRHGELLLKSQQDNMVATESRATAVIAWSVPTILALCAFAIQNQYSGDAAMSAVAAAICLAAAATASVVGLWPQRWGHAGYEPLTLLDDPLPSELEILESIAQGYDTTAQQNDARLNRFARWMRVAWLFFIAAPAIGMLRILIFIMLRIFLR